MPRRNHYQRERVIGEREAFNFSERVLGLKRAKSR